MRYGTTVIISVLTLLVLVFPLTSKPAQAQNPGQILGPLTSPFRMILRSAPRARTSRAYRTPRANREAARERSRTATRRQAALAGAAAAGAVAFWPIGAPDAFADMLGYAFWPRDYDRQFWSHGPRDIMRAMTAPAAAFASQSDDGSPSRHSQATLTGSAQAAESDRTTCIARVKDQAMRPLDRINDTVRLTPEQQQDLTVLRNAVRAAIDDERAACRGDLPATQPERLRAMIDGLWAMRYAEFRIRPAIETFYDSLTEAQKVQLTESPQTVGGSESAPAETPAAICAEAVAGNTNPFQPIQRALRPTDGQRKSLQVLYGASMEMAQFLTTTCPTETPATPMARLGTASDRVISLLHAAMNIEPIFGEFYAGLSDQQRRRLNTAIR